jgi:hypothetical protein
VRGRIVAHATNRSRLKRQEGKHLPCPISVGDWSPRAHWSPHWLAAGLVGASGQFIPSLNNSTATAEPGEPAHFVNGPTGLTQLESDDYTTFADGTIRQSQLSFTASAGQEYLIAVDSFGAATATPG